VEKLIETILLGLIQGVTEWLPVSSTGHLKLAQHFLGWEVPTAFDGILHIGTVIVILFFFRKDIKNVLSALAHLDFKTENGKLIPLIIVGTIPTVIIGLVFGDMIENAFNSVLPIAAALIAFGLVLYLSRIGKEQIESISIQTAAIIGIAQGVAIIPGVSRSGATIVTALLLGIKREKAFKFSFLLSIPSILGAAGLTLYKERHQLITAGIGWTEIIAGTVAAIIIGYFAIRLLQKTLVKRKFYLFAIYCWALGVVLVALSLSGY
jgi:undecaprenyl-diphosphatase